MSLTKRAQAELIEKFGDDLLDLDRLFGRGLDNETCDRVNAIEGQDHLERIAKAFQALGRQMHDECDHAEEAEDRRRDNPLEPDFRRLGQ